MIKYIQLKTVAFKAFLCSGQFAKFPTLCLGKQFCIVEEFMLAKNSDVLCFISPTIQIPLEKNYWETLKILNYINYYIKSWGRFYIDPYGDLAYSLRLDYNVLEKIPDECIQEIECAVDYYSDLFVLLLKTGQGKTLFDDTKQFIDDMWRPLIGK